MYSNQKVYHTDTHLENIIVGSSSARRKMNPGKCHELRKIRMSKYVCLNKQVSEQTMYIITIQIYNPRERAKVFSYSIG